MPADPNCPHCKGRGHIFIDSMTAKRCVCLLRKLYADKMGYLLWNTPTIKTSKLAKKLGENLLLIYDDEDINPHLKYAFIHLGLNAQWLYIDDSSVLQAWLGKPNSARAENLQDLIEYPFMVLRLGTVGYPNKALPGVIHELLIGRILASRVTWIVSPREIKQETCREYSDELMLLLNQYFRIQRPKGQRTQAPQTRTQTHTQTEKPDVEEPVGRGGKPLNAAAVNQFITGRKK